MDDQPDWYVAACLVIGCILAVGLLALMAWATNP